MIKDIEEESKTKFSIEVEFSFSFKPSMENSNLHLNLYSNSAILNFAVSIHSEKVLRRVSFTVSYRSSEPAYL